MALSQKAPLPFPESPTFFPRKPQPVDQSGGALSQNYPPLDALDHTKTPTSWVGLVNAVLARYGFSMGADPHTGALVIGDHDSPLAVADGTGLANAGSSPAIFVV